MTLKEERKVVPTDTLFLTFASPELTKEITVGYLKVKVTLCVPNKFDHTIQRCKVASVCQWCGKDKREGRCEGP